MQNKALLNGLLSVAERRNQYLKSPKNYKEIKDRRSLINFKFKTYQNQIKVNHENRKLMKQLIQAPSRILTPRRGEKGWEKHAEKYFLQKQKFERNVEKKVVAKKHLMEQLLISKTPTTKSVFDSQSQIQFQTPKHHKNLVLLSPTS